MCTCPKTCANLLFHYGLFRLPPSLHPPLPPFLPSLLPTLPPPLNVSPLLLFFPGILMILASDSRTSARNSQAMKTRVALLFICVCFLSGVVAQGQGPIMHAEGVRYCLVPCAAGLALMHAMSVCVGEKTHDICAHTEASESLCGNGMVDELEHCDDGNSESNDGCSSTCTVECGYDCTGGSPSTCASTCGDGVQVAGDEECDDGNAEDGDGCSSWCAVEEGWTCSSATCSTSHCSDADIGDGDGPGTTTTNATAAAAAVAATALPFCLCARICC